MGGPLTAPKKTPTLGAGLRAIRAMADLSLDELAIASGISRNRIHLAERDRRQLDSSDLSRLIQTLAPHAGISFDIQRARPRRRRRVTR